MPPRTAARPATPSIRTSGVEGGVAPDDYYSRPGSPVSAEEQLRRDVDVLQRSNKQLQLSIDYYGVITLVTAVMVAFGAVPVILRENGMSEWGAVFEEIARRAVCSE